MWLIETELNHVSVTKTILALSFLIQLVNSYILFSKEVALVYQSLIELNLFGRFLLGLLISQLLELKLLSLFLFGFLYKL